LAGWWLASAVGTVAVLTLAPRPAANRLRATAARSANVLAEQLEAALVGRCSREQAEASIAVKHELQAVFDAAPYRPTGLAVADQALASLVEALEWLTTVVSEAVREGTDLTTVAETDRRLFGEAAVVLRDTARLLGGADIVPLLGDLEQLRAASAARIAALGDDSAGAGEPVHVSFHARAVAAAVRGAAVDALIASRRAGPEVVAAERARWGEVEDASVVAISRAAFLGTARRLATGHASLRSVWFLNSARGAVALAAAVALADLTNVQHGFWVVLGALSVLRTSAASTGATALRALGGTLAGFFIGGAFILAIGSHLGALWFALPVAVFVASYAPGTAPFVVGQAAFTVTISVLYNIVVPVGWKVGAVRVEDVALGAAVSVLAGVLFWPRGASAIVGDDLADAFHRGGVYLVQATAWAIGTRQAPPDAALPALRANLRLDDAVRALMAEQGTRRVPKDQVWHLVGGAMRLRLTAQSLTGQPRPSVPEGPTHRALVEEAVVVAGICDDLASRLGRVPSTVAQELAALVVSEPQPAPVESGYSLWIRQHLDHIKRDLATLVAPTEAVAAARALPWWR
jgi:uncharacterized membrane protein YccC